MRRIVVGFLVVLSLAACGPDQRECKDGSSTTAAGRGACSGHGGVKR